MAELRRVTTRRVKAPLCFEAATSSFCSVPPKCWLGRGRERSGPICRPQASSITSSFSWFEKPDFFFPDTAAALYLRPPLPLLLAKGKGERAGQIIVDAFHGNASEPRGALVSVKQRSTGAWRTRSLK